ncbi:hypothetical protein BH24GEM3_BH24GEM3_26730 [soil metagenome]
MYLYPATLRWSYESYPNVLRTEAGRQLLDVARPRQLEQIIPEPLDSSWIMSNTEEVSCLGAALRMLGIEKVVRNLTFCHNSLFREW